MFLRILKRDLKRKKTINIIVLLFIILATTFITGSVNSILTIETGLSDFFELSEMPDYLILSIGEDNNGENKKKLEGIEGVTKVEDTECIFCSDSIFYKENVKPDSAFEKQILISSVKNTGIKVFDRNNKVISYVEKGKIFITEKCVLQGDYDIGDTIIVDFGTIKKEFILAGTTKDALCSSGSISISRAIMNDDDFQEIFSETSARCMFYCIMSNDIKKIQESSELNLTTILSNSKDLFLAAYSLEMLVSAVFVIVSVCLLIISCVVLKFIISSTINEEFREIGVMKAIGISNTKIRLLYLVKYFVLSFFGGALGIGLGIPFGNLLLESTNRIMVMQNNKLVLIGILSAIFVILIVLFFSFIYTNKVRHLSPIDAVSNASKQSKSSKKHLFKLKKHIGSSASYLAMNDIVRNKRKFGTLVLVYTICILLTMILSNLSYTVYHKDFLRYCNFNEFDISCRFDSKELIEKGIITEGDTLSQEEQVLDYIEKVVHECGYDGKASAQLSINTKVSFNNASTTCYSTIGVRTKASDYVYVKGTAPQLKNEIAITSVISQKIGATIGDTIHIESTSINGDFIVTAIYQTCMNFGEAMRFNENVEVESFELYTNIGVAFGGYFEFSDNPSDKEIERRIEELSNKMCVKKISSHQEFLNEGTSIIGMLDDVKMVVLILISVIIALITILMERSFALSERTEIALMKAIGYKSRKIYYQHVLRFLFVGILSIGLAYVLSLPVTTLTLNPLFGYLGVTEGMNFKINVLESFVINPIIVLGITCVIAFLTSLFTRSTKSYDTASIE